jgi:hypothetical protein
VTHQIKVSEGYALPILYNPSELRHYNFCELHIHTRTDKKTIEIEVIVSEKVKKYYYISFIIISFISSSRSSSSSSTIYYLLLLLLLLLLLHYY